MVNIFRNWLAKKLGVSVERKAELYLELARSTTLSDPSYWLQTLFAAGIATLGLVLNSPAVIIGAMLISPLMGPILSGGLALATGDVLLGLRSAINLVLSCLVAVAFAFLLVAVLPFKEITNEIAVRTHPNTLDLAVAFFSGAIGSLAICKEVKGVVTSIPGVAIAVALMPPLGVVGYGIAVAVSLNAEDGMRVAFGGGLLFLTNLIAITFTAMIVFLVLHIDTQDVKQRMEEWHEQDAQSSKLRYLTSRLPGVAGVRHIGSLPGRLAMILIILLVILIPLSRSFNQLKSELQAQQDENRVRQVVTKTWQAEFGKQTSGETRSFLDSTSMAEQDGKLTLQLRVLTSKPLTSSEKEQFTRKLETSLSRPRGLLDVQIIETPTTTAAMRLRPPLAAPPPLSVVQLQTRLAEEIEQAVVSLYFPPPASFVDYRLVTTKNGLELAVTYLSDRDIEPDAQMLLEREIRTRFDQPETKVEFLRVPASLGRLFFRRRKSSLDPTSQQTLDVAAEHLQQHPRLRLEVLGDAEKDTQNDTTTQERSTAIKEYLFSQFQSARDRVEIRPGSEAANQWAVNLRLTE